MAIPFLNNINLDDNQLLNAKLQVTSSAPTAAAGQIYFDSTADPAANPPTYDLTAKYYSNATDQWVSLKEYSFPTGTYVTGAVTGTFPKPIITFDLNAVNGVAAETSQNDGIRYLSKNNKWADISTIPGTYAWTISDNANPAVTAGVASGDTLQIAASSDLTSTLTGQAEATKVLTVGLKVGPGEVGSNNNYISNQGIGLADADDSIPFNSYTPGLNPPSTQVNVVKKTTFGTIPVDALTLVKNYIDAIAAGGLTFKGTFRADTGEILSGTSAGLFLYNCPGGAGTRVAVAVGDYYVVATAGGSFYCSGATLDIGDSIIGVTAAAADSSTATNWSIVQSDEGVTDISASDDADLKGINVSASTGSVAVGLDINSLPAVVTSPVDESFLALYDEGEDKNQKILFENFFSQFNAATSKTGTITAGDLSGTVNHTFGINTLVQTINSSGDTVFCDVTRTATTSVATIAVAEATDITILVQKIG